jgi:pyruvate/2-oxoglutarate dehydrogenase complex dihydrolipoamide dehydrogenase (E3) component
MDRRSSVKPGLRSVTDEILQPELCVIGGGAGGVAIATAVARAGVPVVLVERSAPQPEGLAGGPLAVHALNAAASVADTMRRSDRFGLPPADPVVSHSLIQRRVRDILAETARERSPERLRALGIHVEHAAASFGDTRTVIAGDLRIRARRFVIATGARAVLPDLPGLSDVDRVSPDTILTLARLPAHLIVIGDGPEALEAAQAYRRLGSGVSVIAPGPVLSLEDREMTEIVLASLRGEGIDVWERAGVVAIRRRSRGGIRMELEGAGGRHRLDGSHLLVAPGRVADIDGLNLGAAGVGITDAGIAVDDRLRTRNRRIHAMGDAIGPVHGADLVHRQASLIARSILGEKIIRQAPAFVPRAMFTDPGLAHVGLDEGQARAAGRRVQVVRVPLGLTDRARIDRRTRGHMKLVADDSERILGVTLCCAAAADLIGIWSLAMAQGARLRDIADLPLPYPTVSEIGKRAAMAYFAPSERNHFRRALVKVLRLFE